MYTASDLRKGLKIELDGVPYEVVEFNFVKPGKGQAMYKCRIKNLITQTTQDRTFREVDQIGRPDLEERVVQYSYEDGHHYVFTDPRTYEEFHLSEDTLGDARYFLSDNVEVSLLFHNGRVIGVEFVKPFVEKEIVETEPGVRGDTATNVTKPAKIDTGYELRVPLFIDVGDVVRIDTRSGQYVERVSRR